MFSRMSLPLPYSVGIHNEGTRLYKVSQQQGRGVLPRSSLIGPILFFRKKTRTSRVLQECKKYIFLFVRHFVLHCFKSAVNTVIMKLSLFPAP